MVDYIGTERLLELVARVGTAQFIEGLAAEIEADFLRWNVFEKSARHATHSAVGVIELMPACDGHLYSFKYVNGHPKNTNQGLLTVTAFGVLADVGTGYPLLLSEMTYATALRTAATAVLAARTLARRSSRVMALIGNGAQSEFQAVGFHHMLGIRELRLYDTDLRATLKLERNLALLNLPGLHVVRCSSTAQAVRGADIVTTVTADKCKAIILTPEMIEPGMHLNALGGDCPGKTELHPDVLRRPDACVVVEFEPQSRIEVIQGGLNPQGSDPMIRPIALEGTDKTGLRNTDGTIAMARTQDPNSATTEFFIDVGDDSFLDAGGPTGPGYAAFGKVIRGMDVVLKIQRADASGETLAPPVKIIKASRLR